VFSVTCVTGNCAAALWLEGGRWGEFPPGLVGPTVLFFVWCCWLEPWGGIVAARIYDVAVRLSVAAP